MVGTQSNTADGELWVSARLTLLPRFLAQAAELIALNEALTLITGKSVTIYSDSAYITTTVHSSIARWRRRGILKSNSTPIMHRELLELLIDALALPKWVALVKCAAHTGGKDFVSRGNALADHTAKEAAYRTCAETHMLLVQPPTDFMSPSQINHIRKLPGCI